MTVPPPPRPLYLDVQAGPVLAFLHGTTATPALAGVLFCPPFGWDDICSYRSRREWATQLAAKGHPALRFDLPGAGDSAGTPCDADLLGAWTNAVAAAASTLRSETGCPRVVAVGIGLGGLLAWRAAAAGAAVDDFVLWAVPARGRTLVRELRAFSLLEEVGIATAEAPDPPPLPEGWVEAAGFVLTAETRKDLEALDVTTLELPPGDGRRALLLDRDGVGVDERLQAHLEGSGIEVAAAEGRGYGEMMAKPQEALPPMGVFGEVAQWLEGAPSSSPSPVSPEPVDHTKVTEMRVGEGRVRERPLMGERLFGILTEPAEGPTAGVCAVLLNAGAIRHIGPNRMWVEAARRWASLGVPTLRVDIEGIGDADGDAARMREDVAFYIPRRTEQALSLVDELTGEGMPDRFILGGLCSGAYWAFHGALRDSRVTGALMLNPRVLFWNPSLIHERDARKVLGGVGNTIAWRRLFSGEITPRRLLELIGNALRSLARGMVDRIARPRKRRSAAEDVVRALDRLRENGKAATIVFSAGEPLLQELERDGHLSELARWPNVRLDVLSGPAHTFPPLWAQRRVHELMDEALATQLGGEVDSPLMGRTR